MRVYFPRNSNPTNGAHGQFLLQIFNFATVILTAYMMWRGLGVILNNESPIVVVLRYD